MISARLLLGFYRTFLISFNIYSYNNTGVDSHNNSWVIKPEFSPPDGSGISPRLGFFVDIRMEFIMAVFRYPHHTRPDSGPDQIILVLKISTEPIRSWYD